MTVEREKIGTLTNEKSGKVTDVYAGDRLVSKKQSESYKKKIKNDDESYFIKQEFGGFFFLFFKNKEKLMHEHPELCEFEITKLIYIAGLLDYDNYLKINNNFVSRKILESEIGLSRNKFSIFYKKMKSLGILIEEDNKISLKKEYFFKGSIDYKKESDVMYGRFFNEELKYIYKNLTIRNHNMFGIFLNLIPYIHRERNIICFNPEDDYENIKPMRVRDLKQIINYSGNASELITNLLKIRTRNDEPLILFVRGTVDESKSIMIFNPKIFYGGNFYFVKENYETLKGYFEQQKESETQFEGAK